MPTWEDSIQKQEVVFVGSVVGIHPNQRPGWPDIVTFDVETPVRGAVQKTFDVEQGGDGECSTAFSLGDHVIYADGSLPVASVILSDPVTSHEQAQLDFVLGLRAGNAAEIGVTLVEGHEMMPLLSGCWAKEQPSDRDFDYSLCFRSDGSLLASYFGAREGLEGVGSFLLTGDKLQIDQTGIPARLFETDRVSCDVLVRAKFGMKLYNCAGYDGRGNEIDVPDTSYAYEGAEQR
jgi:hypothetical protein